MSGEVCDQYDAVAELYAELNLDALVHDADARQWLAAFAEVAAQSVGPIADLGCGPGHVVDHLAQMGLPVIGYDLSPGQLAQARLVFPGRRFELGDLMALDVPDASIGGIVARYSIIHVPPHLLDAAFEEWMRVLEPGAPAVVSFFGALSADAHGTPFDHRVTTAYELWPATIAHQLEQIGFVDIEVGTCPSPDGVRPFDQATVLARNRSSDIGDGLELLVR